LSNKFILDATAGYRMMWVNKNHPNTLYIDKRPEVNPDIVTEWKNLQFIPDKAFKLIVFDPPHIIQNSDKGNLVRDYGRLSPATWQEDLQAGFKELWRVLDDYGILIFKWSELCHKSLKQVLDLFPEKPLFSQISRVKADHFNRESHTYWCCFMKITGENRN